MVYRAAFNGWRHSMIRANFDDHKVQPPGSTTNSANNLSFTDIMHSFLFP